jgi:hypothetical protein
MSVREELLRRRNRECAERRRYLADLELLSERLHADASQLLTESAEAGGIGGPAAVEPLIESRTKIMRSIAELDREIAAARVSLATAEQELRRHEIAGLRSRNAQRRHPRHTRRMMPRP